MSNVKLSVYDIKAKFLNYFKDKEHLELPSSSIVPKDDDSVFFINAGMTPLKKYFTREKIPPKNRIITCQRCIRTTDLDSVGKTPFHLTFFEMLGNFSFGDYFKKEAIEYAWEFLTKEIKLDKNRLYITVFEDDKETYDIWRNDIKIPKNHIRKGDINNNFWKHGVGPCGPCTEIYYDRGEKYGEGEVFSIDSKLRYVEIWNIVFSEYENTNTGELIPLKNKNIDTGMGLERLAMVVQDVSSVFEIDSFRHLESCVAFNMQLILAKNNINFPKRIHYIKTLIYLLGEGVTPANTGRGYIVRKIFKCLFNLRFKFSFETSKISKEKQKELYLEMLEYTFKTMKSMPLACCCGISNFNFNNIKSIFIQELNMYFDKTLKAYKEGYKLIDKLIKKAEKNNNTVTEKDIFHIYETHGLSMDLIKKKLKDNHIKILTIK